MGVDGGGNGDGEKHCWEKEDLELLRGKVSEIKENVELEEEMEVRSCRNVGGEGKNDDGELTIDESSESRYCLGCHDQASFYFIFFCFLKILWEIRGNGVCNSHIGLLVWGWEDTDPCLLWIHFRPEMT